MSSGEHKRLVPKLRFVEFIHDKNWLKSSINKLVKDELIFSPKDGNHGNIHPKSTDYVEYGIPFIMANDIRNGNLDLLKCSHISKEQADSLQKGFSRQDDVLLTHKGTVGEVTIVKKNNFPYVMLTPQVTYYRVRNKKRLFNEFLAYSFTSEYFQRKIFNASGGGTRAYIGITEQQKLDLMLPPTIEEQQKIADCLTSIDDNITAQTQKLESLKDHKKGLMQKLFPAEGETVPEVRFGEFEGEWELKAFSDSIKLYRGSSPRPIKNYLTKSLDGVNWIKIGDTSTNDDFYIRAISEKITAEGAKKSRSVKKGELILANSMSFGSTYELEIDGCIYDGWFVLRNFEEAFDKKFLLQILNSNYMQEQYKKYAAGGIVQNISSEIVYKTVLPVTTKKEQQEIANCLSSIDELITAQTQKIEHLKAHKKGLMQQLFPEVDA